MRVFNAADGAGARDAAVDADHGPSLRNALGFGINGTAPGRTKLIRPWFGGERRRAPCLGGAEIGQRSNPSVRRHG